MSKKRPDEARPPGNGAKLGTAEAARRNASLGTGGAGKTGQTDVDDLGDVNFGELQDLAVEAVPSLEALRQRSSPKDAAALDIAIRVIHVFGHVRQVDRWTAEFSTARDGDEEGDTD